MRNLKKISLLCTITLTVAVPSTALGMNKKMKLIKITNTLEYEKQQLKKHKGQLKESEKKKNQEEVTLLKNLIQITEEKIKFYEKMIENKDQNTEEFVNLLSQLKTHEDHQEPKHIK